MEKGRRTLARWTIPAARPYLKLWILIPRYRNRWWRVNGLPCLGLAQIGCGSRCIDRLPAARGKMRHLTGESYALALTVDADAGGARAMDDVKSRATDARRSSDGRRAGEGPSPFLHAFRSRGDSKKGRGTWSRPHLRRALTDAVQQRATDNGGEIGEKVVAQTRHPRVSPDLRRRQVPGAQRWLSARMRDRYRNSCGESKRIGWDYAQTAAGLRQFRYEKPHHGLFAHNSLFAPGAGDCRSLTTGVHVWSETAASCAHITLGQTTDILDVLRPRFR